MGDDKGWSLVPLELHDENNDIEDKAILEHGWKKSSNVIGWLQWSKPQHRPRYGKPRFKTIGNDLNRSPYVEF